MERKRFVSLDVFRGFTIAAMILVNFPGNWDHVFHPLRHTVWWGISFTDLIAPFFLFTVGVSIALAYSGKLAAGKKPRELYRKIIIRSLKIFAVGMFLNLLGILDHFSWAELRWTGTLHRIAIVFLFCGMLFIHTNWKTQAVVGALLLVLYHVAMVFIPTPGFEQAMLEPGVNLAAWVDQQLLPGKMWQGNWDPEGILSTFPSFATGITGMLAGRLLLSQRTTEQKIIALFFWGFVFCAIGMAWSWSFGLNENLWSPSFVMFTSGLAALTLASLSVVIDLQGQVRWARFGITYGMNAIAVYVLADILAIFFYGIPLGGASLNMHAFNGLTGIGVAPKVASMIFGLFFVCVNFIPALLLYRKNIFIKL